MPLTPLPIRESKSPGKPNPQLLKRLKLLLANTSDRQMSVRTEAHELALEARRSWLPSIAFLIDEIAERRDRSNMAKVLKKTIDKTRLVMKQQGRGTQATPDYLDILLARPQTENRSWKNLVELLSLSRMLVQLNSAEACRQLIRIYLRFGEFLRIDTQRQLELLGDASIGALIEAQRHPAEKIQNWATKQLKVRHMSTPQEAVRTDDPYALADILNALGTLKDAENARLILSYASSERSIIRNGARQGIVELGSQAHWQLKDAYLAITGKSPKREWTWKRTARELFTEYDRIRVQELYELYARARTLTEEGEAQAAAETFSELLSLEPEFSEAPNIAPLLLKNAETLYSMALSKEGLNASALRELAATSAYRVERISSEPKHQKRAKALLLAAQVHSLLERGLDDRALRNQAMELNPELVIPDANVGQLSMTSESGLSELSRYSLALFIGLLSLLGITVILRGLKAE